MRRAPWTLDLAAWLAEASCIAGARVEVGLAPSKARPGWYVAALRCVEAELSAAGPDSTTALANVCQKWERELPAC